MIARNVIANSIIFQNYGIDSSLSAMNNQTWNITLIIVSKTTQLKPYEYFISRSCYYYESDK